MGLFLRMTLFFEIMIYSAVPLKQTPLGPMLCVCNMEVLGVIMCTWAGEHNKATFSDFFVAVQC